MPELPDTVGKDLIVNTLSGVSMRYVNLDNTATTPAFREVYDAVNGYLAYYGSIHRGSGFKSLYSSWLYEQARNHVRDFVGANRVDHQVLFTSNTTTAINKAARILQLRRRDLVLISDIEHSSNDLPWRQWATLKRFRTGFDNTVDLESLATALDRHGKNVKLVAISGASNVTGYITPISDVATIAHSFGVPIFVDCAQLAPHRKISMGSATDDGRIDFVAFSGHKMGAPYGTGVLICPSGLVASSEIPSDEPGGGTADLVTDNRVFWSDSPERHEAGTPNAVGVIALAKAIEVLESLGFDNIQEHEKNLWVKACAGLARIKGVELYVNPTNASRHTPVLPFNLEGMHHGIVAAILGFEYAIGVRHGRHCADNLVMRLTGFPKHRREDLIKEAIQGGKTTQVYGIVRPSIGISNTDEDIERLLDAVGRIAQDGTKIEYEPEIRRTKSCALSRETGEFIPRGMDVRALIGLGIDQNRGHFEPIHANYD